MKLISLIAMSIILPFAVMGGAEGVAENLIEVVANFLPDWLKALFLTGFLLAFLKGVRKIKKALKLVGVNIPWLKAFLDPVIEGLKFIDGVLNPAEDPDEK